MATPTVPFLDLHAAYREDAPAYDAAYARVMASGRWIQGPELMAFEQEFAQQLGGGEVVGVGNGLDALRLALQVAGVGPGDEVVVPAHTFIATWLAVQQVGATPVPVEPDDGAFTISAAQVAQVLGPRTRAVMPVHLYGHAADPQGLQALCARSGLLLLEDAAQAHGGCHRGQALGTFGRLAGFSFYPGKNLGAFGDAGAVWTCDTALAQALRAQRNYGSLQRYQHEQLGTNSRLDELQAAFLRVRLRRLGAHNARRQAIAARYQTALGDLPWLRLPATLPGCEPAWHLYVVRSAQRDALQTHLRRQGVETLIHYPRPVYRCPPFHAHAPRQPSASDRLCNEILSLPMGPHLTDAQVDQVIAGLRSFDGAR